MYKKKDQEGQYQLDTRSDSEISLDEAVVKILQAAKRHVRAKVTSDVKNRYEGYGILAEGFKNLDSRAKTVANGMKSYLGFIDSSDRMAVDAASSILNSLTDMLVDVAVMAAQAERISDDLYDNAFDEPTPIEKMEENDGFEEPESEDADGEDAV